MTNILDLVKKTGCMAPVITIYGKGMIGKTTLASKFPDPLFLFTEDCGLEGINGIDCMKDYSYFYNVVKQLTQIENPEFKTIVLDSLSGLDKLITNHILEKEFKETGVKSLGLASAYKGYARGYSESLRVHSGTRMLFRDFTLKGITVVFIGHMEMSRQKKATGEEYMIYDIVMEAEKAKRCYTDSADAVLAGFQKSFVVHDQSDKKQIKPGVIHSVDDIYLMTGINEMALTKNRFNMPKEIPMTFEAIAKYIPFYTGEVK